MGAQCSSEKSADTPGAASGSDGASGATGSQPVKSKKSGKKTSGDDNKPIPEPAERKSKPVRQVLCEYDELQDGQMKEVEVEGSKVLLARDQGAYYAVSAKCTHFGASLAKGALCNGRVRCPWHGASFDLATGDIEDFPGLDSLQSFDVAVKDGKVEINTDTVALTSTKRVKHMLSRDLECTLLYLIVGGGPAAMECVEALRQEGYKGKILIVTQEDDPPYDRTKLSKALSSTAADLALRPMEFYNVYDIDIMTGMEAFSIDTEMNHMVFRGGEYTDYTIEYDQAMICTGSRPIKLDKPGTDTFTNDILYLRTPHEANNIATRAKDKNVVIVGSSFIGMEVAAFLQGKAKSVTVLGRSAIPFAKLLGEQVGKIIHDLFVSKGVKMLMETEVEELIGNEENLTQIKLTNSETIAADICIVGIGVLPNTEWLADTSVTLTSSGHIKVNQYNTTSVDNVFAGGDCCAFPLFLSDNQHVSIGHYQMALAHGKSAGSNMCFKEEPLKSVPYFWTQVFGKSFRYCGVGSAISNEVIFHGDETKFVTFYVSDLKVVAVSSFGWDPIVSVAAELMRAGISIPAANIRENPDKLSELLPK